MIQNVDTANGKVLIVEDEDGAARLVASLCDELGLASQATRSGVEAMKLVASGAPYSCAVIDLVLAEGDGFTVAQSLRAQRPELPLLVVSGVYKQLPSEFLQRVKPEVFLPKPFEPSRVRSDLARLCKIEPPHEQAGDLSQTPVAQLYVELLRHRAFGVLTLRRDHTLRQLHFQGGVLRFAQSNVKTETAGQAQVQSGLIKQASFDRAVALAKQQKIPLHEALAAARVMTLDQLKAALKQQTCAVALAGLSWTAGQHTFETLTPEQLEQLPEGRASVVSLVLDWAQHVDDPGEARRWLEAHAQDRMSRSTELDRELFALRAHWPGESLSPLASNNRTIGEVLSHVKEPELTLFHALCLSGLVTLTHAAVAAGGPSAAEGKASTDEDQGKVFSAKEQEARRMLFGERDRMKDASQYEVLGIGPTATDEQVKAAFIAAARRLHSDRFSGLDLGSARKVGEALFQKINEAHTVLSSAKDRAEYDVFLDCKSKGLPTDVAAILKAEAIFQRGEILFHAGKWEDAESAFRDAVGLNHAEAEFHAYLGMTVFKRLGKWQDAIAHIEKALELDPRLLSGQVFAATLKAAQGDVGEACAMLQKVLEQQPDYAPAQAELHKLKTAQKAPKKGGFFSGLFKKSGR